jgi:hypothetical protein
MNHLLRSALSDSLTSHGVPVVEIEDGTFSAYDGELVLAGSVYEHSSGPKGVLLIVEVRAASPRLGDNVIVTSFGGHGEDLQQAFAQGYVRFLSSTFHVLLEALTSHSCDSPQAEIEVWRGEDCDWRAYIGPVIAHHSGEDTLSADYSAFHTQLRSLAESSLGAGTHWFSLFLGAFSSQVQTAEVLLDNQPWDAAQALLASHEWQATEQFQSLRNFSILVPADGV